MPPSDNSLASSTDGEMSIKFPANAFWRLRTWRRYLIHAGHFSGSGTWIGEGKGKRCRTRRNACWYTRSRCLGSLSRSCNILAWSERWMLSISSPSRFLMLIKRRRLSSFVIRLYLWDVSRTSKANVILSYLNASDEWRISRDISECSPTRRSFWIVSLSRKASIFNNSRASIVTSRSPIFQTISSALSVDVRTSVEGRWKVVCFCLSFLEIVRG